MTGCRHVETAQVIGGGSATDGPSAPDGITQITLKIANRMMIGIGIPKSQSPTDLIFHLYFLDTYQTYRHLQPSEHRILIAVASTQRCPPAAGEADDDIAMHPTDFPDLGSVI